MPVRRPLSKLDLRDKLRLEPDAVLHLLSRERRLRAFLFPVGWRTGKRRSLVVSTFAKLPDELAARSHFSL